MHWNSPLEIIYLSQLVAQRRAMINDTGGHGQQPQNSTRPHAHENVADKTCMDSKPSAKVMICQIPLLILHPQRRLGRKKNCVDIPEEYLDTAISSQTEIIWLWRCICLNLSRIPPIRRTHIEQSPSRDISTLARSMSSGSPSTYTRTIHWTWSVTSTSIQR